MKHSGKKQNSTIRRQLLYAFSLVITISVITATLILSRNSYATIKENSLINFTNTNKQISSGLDENIATIDNYYFFVISNRKIFNGLQKENFGANADSYDSVLLLKDLLYSYISITNGLDSAFYISREGVLVTSLSGMIYPGVLGHDQFLDLPFIEEINEDPTRNIWYTGMLKDIGEILYVRGIRHPGSGEILGYLCLLIDEKYFLSLIDDLSHGKSDYYICDSQSTPIFGTSQELEFTNELKQNIVSRIGEPAWSFGNTYFYVGQTQNSWLIVSELDKSDLLDVRKIFILGILAALFSMVPVIFIGMYYSKKYASDVGHVISAMENSSREKLLKVSGQPNSREMKILSDHYNNMVDDITNLTTSLRNEIDLKNRMEKERKKLESQLHQSQKMEAVGQLAGGVAHDFNNLLTAIFGYVDLGKMALEEGAEESEIIEFFGEIETVSQRAANLTRQLLTFSRKDRIELKLLDLNNVINGMGRMLKRLIKDSIKLTVITGESLCGIMSDQGHIEQILVNLVVNASHAMPHGGDIEVETSNILLGEEYARLHPESKAGLHVMLSVSDTGEGMEKEVLEKIFEPFYTTKGPEKGTGLGLATVHGIVKQGGGHITVNSVIGKGTVFKLFFPAVGEEIHRDQIVSKSGKSSGSSRKILPRPSKKPCSRII